MDDVIILNARKNTLCVCSSYKNRKTCYEGEKIFRLQLTKSKREFCRVIYDAEYNMRECERKLLIQNA